MVSGLLCHLFPGRALRFSQGGVVSMSVEDVIWNALGSKTDHVSWTSSENITNHLKDLRKKLWHDKHTIMSWAMRCEESPDDFPSVLGRDNSSSPGKHYVYDIVLQYP
jgi:hypothetical protein